MNDDRNDTKKNDSAPARPEPWWRVGTMWLVLGGPALVVVAGFATLAIALRYGDVPLNKVSAEAAESMAPATQARNHVTRNVR